MNVEGKGVSTAIQGGFHGNAAGFQVASEQRFSHASMAWDVFAGHDANFFDAAGADTCLNGAVSTHRVRHGPKSGL